MHYHHCHAMATSGLCQVIILCLSISVIICSDSEDSVHDFGFESDSKYNSALKEPISTPEDYLTLKTGRDVLPKLVRLITDAEFRDQKIKALKTVTPQVSSDILRDKLLDKLLTKFGDKNDQDSISSSEKSVENTDIISSRISDKDLDILDPILDLLPDIPLQKIHIHHIFPPHLIRPLQKLIIRKIMKIIKNPPLKKFKKKVKRVSRVGTVALGLGLAHDAVKEIKSQPTTAQYKVTGLVDLSGQKHYKDDYEYKYKDLKEDKYEERSDDEYPDLEDEHKGKVKDYKLESPTLAVEKKIYWPFHESKEEIYEKWNRFPAPYHPDPFPHKIKHMHKTFHAIHPDILHIIKDVHGLVGAHGTKVISAGPDLEHPIVLAGQLVKLLDSLIPSIRIRIPFIEYLVHSFYKKSKPKVVYVKQPPKIKYVGLPYQEDSDMRPDMPVPEPMPVEVPMPVPEVSPYRKEDESGADVQRLISPQMTNKNYEVLTRGQLAEDDSPLPNRFNSRPNYDQRGQYPSYSSVFNQAVQVYRDKKRARA